MNYIGIIGAMDEEVAQLIAAMEDVKKTTIAGMDFYDGILWDKKAVVVMSGIGKVNMAACTQILASVYGVDALINTGVAGGLYGLINIGDIVLSEDALQHDMDATGFGYELGVIPRMEQSIFKGDPVLIEKAKAACEKVNPEISVYVGRVVSGDQFISSDDVKKHLIDTFGGYCAEMEGASMAQVAYLNNIPFVVVRAISDKADHSAEMNYAEFEHAAIVHTVKLLEEMFKNL
ncbi:MAG: 5'-methylthioadenosine/adenosylhomocysteine nucleosidase [Lachnospiraceae bacterium]|nr:5'-methylthioadenosine/adenosylhomocysteine nucleosidase [Lachnospiraceae bacterium]